LISKIRGRRLFRLRMPAWLLLLVGRVGDLLQSLGIDTGAAYGGWLTCVQLEDARVVNTYQVHTDDLTAWFASKRPPADPT
ncbi:MAG: hypothetical protein VCF07_10780, partial [Nitrospinota bacterium]